MKYSLTVNYFTWDLRKPVQGGTQVDFTGRTAIVTGGSRGIGRAVAEGLVRSRCRVLVGYKSRQEAAEGVVRSLSALGTAACGQVDVTDPVSVAAFVAAAEERFGPVDILVNSAGVAYRRTLAEVELPEWEDVLRVNLTGTFLMIRAVAPGMVQRRYGRIVNIASIAGRTGGRIAPHYAAAKGGVIALTANLGRELAPMGVTVNCLAPDLTDTEMVEGMSLGSLMPALLASSPMGRLARPGEVAAAALFLADESASFINGECLGITGGR